MRKVLLLAGSTLHLPPSQHLKCWLKQIVPFVSLLPRLSMRLPRSPRLCPLTIYIRTSFKMPLLCRFPLLRLHPSPTVQQKRKRRHLKWLRPGISDVYKIVGGARLTDIAIALWTRSPGLISNSRTKIWSTGWTQLCALTFLFVFSCWTLMTPKAQRTCHNASSTRHCCACEPTPSPTRC